MNMKKYITLRDRPELKDVAAMWFHSKWNVQENADFILTIPETGSYQITVTGHQAEGKISFVCPQKRDREIKARLSYRSIEIQSDTEPYELTVFLDGEGNASESDFENAAKLAFDYIKNMGTICFCMEATKEEVASFER